MAYEDYSGTGIITIGPAGQDYDQDLHRSLVGLHKKTQGYCIDWHTGPKDVLKGVQDIRLYLHGHGNFQNQTLGNLNASAVAEGLVDYYGLSQGTAKVVSITGCNAARGTACFDAVAVASREMIGESEHPDHPHLTRQRLTTDSRLVDTSRTAAELCTGSFAQLLHRELANRGVHTMIYARLYVVVVEDDGEKRTLHYDPRIVAFSKGNKYDASFTHNDRYRTKIRITGTSGMQNIEYVEYDDAAKAAARMKISVIRRAVYQELRDKFSQR